jgi:hypothetical protein
MIPKLLIINDLQKLLIINELQKSLGLSLPRPIDMIKKWGIFPLWDSDLSKEIISISKIKILEESIGGGFAPVGFYTPFPHQSCRRSRNSHVLFIPRE